MRGLSTGLWWEAVWAEPTAAQGGKDERAGCRPEEGQAPVTPISIQGVSVGIVEVNKYLGVYTGDELDWA